MTEPRPAAEAPPTSEKQFTVRYAPDLPRSELVAAAAEDHLAPSTWARVILARELEKRRRQKEEPRP